MVCSSLLPPPPAWASELLVDVADGGVVSDAAKGRRRGIGVGASSGSGVERRPPLRRVRPVRRALMIRALDFLYAERTSRSMEFLGSAAHQHT